MVSPDPVLVHDAVGSGTPGPLAARLCDALDARIYGRAG
jgi:hypothetical protein